MCDSAKNAIFKKSFAKQFAKDSQGNLKFGSNANLTVIPSRHLKICGAIGNCVSANRKNNYVSEVVIGTGNTNSWNLGGLGTTTTLAIYFDVVNTIQPNSPFNVHIQFFTRYLHSSGQFRLRVTTL